MCSVRAEDSGEIKFVARHVESVAHLEVEGILINENKPVGVSQDIGDSGPSHRGVCCPI